MRPLRPSVAVFALSLVGMFSACAHIQPPVVVPQVALTDPAFVPTMEAYTSAALYYALMFLLVGLVAGALGMFGVAAVATQIAWILFLVGVILLVVNLASGRGVRVP